jgi:hypothetical protein
VYLLRGTVDARGHTCDALRCALRCEPAKDTLLLGGGGPWLYAQPSSNPLRWCALSGALSFAMASAALVLLDSLCHLREHPSCRNQNSAWIDEGSPVFLRCQYGLAVFAADQFSQQ